MFQSRAIWGLGKYDESLLNDIKQNKDKSHLQLRITDALVSLAQSIGVMQLTSAEQQGIEPQLKLLNVDLPRLLEDVERQLGFDLNSPRLAASYGCLIGDKFVTLDGVINGYIAHRLIQLGLTKTKMSSR